MVKEVAEPDDSPPNKLSLFNLPGNSKAKENVSSFSTFTATNRFDFTFGKPHAQASLFQSVQTDDGKTNFTFSLVKPEEEEKKAETESSGEEQDSPEEEPTEVMAAVSPKLF